MKTLKIFSVRSSPYPPIFIKIAVRSSPEPAKNGFSPDPVLIRTHLCYKHNTFLRHKVICALPNATVA